MSSPSARTAEGGLRDFYLESACAGDPAFRAEVEGLLREHTRLGGFLATSPGTERHGPTVTLEPKAPRAISATWPSCSAARPRVLLRDAGPVEADTEPVGKRRKTCQRQSRRPGDMSSWARSPGGGWGQCS